VPFPIDFDFSKARKNSLDKKELSVNSFGEKSKSTKLELEKTSNIRNILDYFESKASKSC
jgi:hypothetical protein